MTESKNKPRINFKCMFGFHTWEKWKSKGQVDITHYPYGIVSEHLKGVSCEGEVFTRECATCGLVQFKTLEY